ncbi:TetR/AcrR family transcriptional regulator [Vibrio kasasachensis]|uniref:TetR/AcrR family transcriptional regulator n=1 Tax=Vibrio kasasachensis TaxID=2910248 RepID=UPI003D146988
MVIAKTDKAEKTINKIIETTMNITLNEGFDKATFAYIAKLAGISKSGINAHFDRKSDIAAALAPLYAEIIKRPLKFDSPEEFYCSWVEAFNNDSTFKAAILTAESIIPQLDGVKGLFDAINGDPDEVQRCVYMCVGYSVINR